MTTKYELRQRVYEEVYVVHDAFATAGEALHALSETFAPGEHYLDPHGRYVAHPEGPSWGSTEEDLYDGELHYGSRLAFAPDGKLFVTIGSLGGVALLSFADTAEGPPQRDGLLGDAIVPGRHRLDDRPHRQLRFAVRHMPLADLHPLQGEDSVQGILGLIWDLERMIAEYERAQILERSRRGELLQGPALGLQPEHRLRSHQHQSRPQCRRRHPPPMSRCCCAFLRASLHARSRPRPCERSALAAPRPEHSRYRPVLPRSHLEPVPISIRRVR